jgi:hypothetical protein
MMQAVIRSAGLAVLLALVAACGEPRIPTAPTPPFQPAPPIAPAPTPTPPVSDFPPVSRPARIYVFDRQASYPVQPYTVGSRYVLYDDGTFALQYLIAGEYRGRYREASTTVTFDFDSFSAAGATATLAGDTLKVQYTMLMSLSDFEDAIYVRNNGRQD